MAVDIERSTAFFNQDVRVLAAQLQGRAVMDLSSGKLLHLTRVEPWVKKPSEEEVVVGRKYRAMEQMGVGDLWIFPRTYPARMCQTLVVAKDGDLVGACVRIVRASRFDADENRFITMPREGDVATFLGLGPFAKGHLRLFEDDPEFLYLIREEKTLSQREVNREMERLFGR